MWMLHVAEGKQNNRFSVQMTSHWVWLEFLTKVHFKIDKRNEQMCLKSHWSVAIVVLQSKTYYNAEKACPAKFPCCVGLLIFRFNKPSRVKQCVNGEDKMINWSKILLAEKIENWSPGNDLGWGFFLNTLKALNHIIWFIQVHQIAEQNEE